MKKTRILSLILAGLMIGGSFISCSDNQVEESDTTPSVESDSSETTADAEETGTHYYNDIPAEDYEGWTFSITSNGTPGDTNVCYVTIEEVNGDEFNDSLYNRRISMEDKFNIKITDKYGSDPVADVKLSVRANTRDFSIGLELMEWVSSLVTSRIILPITDLSVNLDNPYWDQGAKEKLTINGKMFYGLSDISYDHYESCAVLFYNGYHLTNNGISESPYDLYVEGKWTLDAMKEMMGKVSRDLNGDGKMEEGVDLIGLGGRILRNQPALASSATDIVRYDETAETYILDMTGDYVVSIGEKLSELVYDESISFMEGSARTEFAAGRLLFDSHLLFNYRDYRENEDDYGIITWPSLEENTDGWVYVRNPLCVFVPAECDDTDRLSVLLDAMAAYSYDYIIDNYINKAVVGKGARDRQSAEVVRDMMGRRYYDIMGPFGLGDIPYGCENAVKRGTYASLAKSAEKVFNKNINTTLDAYYD